MEKWIIISTYAINPTTGMHYVFALHRCDSETCDSVEGVTVKGHFVTMRKSYSEAEAYVKENMPNGAKSCQS